MDRRTFLRRGLLGGAVLALGGVGLTLLPTAHLADPRGPLSVLDAREFQVLVAVAQRMLAGVPEVDPVRVAGEVDLAITRAHPEARTELKTLLWLFENALPGVLFDLRVRPFTHLSPDAQDAVLASWRDSLFAVRRAGYGALRKLCLAYAYADPATWPALHYPGPPSTGGVLYDDSKAGTPEWLRVVEPEADKGAP
jgi:hypothetical protein